MTTPLVTIVTPAYNAARFLPAHLTSVAMQTFEDYEHVIVNDGSTDETAELLDEAARRDPRVRVIHQPNGGAVAARNTALAAAEGRYIAFLDADDLWLPEKLEHQLAFMQERRCAMSYHHYRTLDEEGNLLSEKPIWMPKSVDYRGYLRLNGTIGNLTVMIDRDLMGDFRMPDRPAEDFALFLILLKRHPAQGLFEDLARHRVVAGVAVRQQGERHRLDLGHLPRAGGHRLAALRLVHVPLRGAGGLQEHPAQALAALLSAAAGARPHAMGRWFRSHRGPARADVTRRWTARTRRRPHPRCRP